MNIMNSGSISEPDYSMALARVKRMTREELDELLNGDGSKMEEYINSLEQIRKLYNEKEELMVQNKSMAEYNLSQEPILNAKREKIAERHREALRLINSVKEAREELEKKSGKVQPETLLNLLEVEQANAERESDDVANEFLDGKLDSIEDFLDKFLTKRKLMYLRRVKSDKLKEILSNPQPKSTPARKAPMPPGSSGTPGVATYTPPSGMPYNVSGAYAPVTPMSWSTSGGAAPVQPSTLPYPLQPTMAMPMPNFR